MPGLHDLLSGRFSLFGQSTDKEKETQDRTEKKAESVASTDDESIDDNDDEPTPLKDTADDRNDQTSPPSDGLELTFDEFAKENVDDKSIDDDDKPTTLKDAADDRNDHTGLPSEGVELTSDEFAKLNETHEAKRGFEKVEHEGEPEPESKKPSKRLLGSWLKNKTSIKSNTSEPKIDDVEGGEDYSLLTTKENKSTSELKMDDEEGGEDYSLLTYSEENESLLSTDQSSTFEEVSPLKALAAAQQEAINKEMDELISVTLVGFDDEVIEKELDDQKSAVSIAEYVVEDVFQMGEGLVAALVNRMDYVASYSEGCTSRCGTRNSHSDDDMALETASIQSRQGGDKKEMDELASNDVIAMELDSQKSTVSTAEYKCISKDVHEGLSAACVDLTCGGYGTKYSSRHGGNIKEIDDLVLSVVEEVVLDDGDTVTLSVNGDDNTIATFDGESLVSEYADFNKAVMMLKRRAAHHRLSHAQLLQKIQAEQERRKSQGLTPTMIEI